MGSIPSTAEHYNENNDVDGWLQKSAGEVLIKLAEGMRFNGRPVCEIGVHHGKLAILLGHLGGGRVVGYDLFERQAENIDRSGRGNRQMFLENCRKYGIDDERVVAITANSLEITADDVIRACGEPPVLFSVDGGHTEQLTTHDLTIAAGAVAPDGIVVLDDFFNAVFPEVSVGAFQFMLRHPGQLVPFCICGGKVFFARSEESGEKYLRMLFRRRYRHVMRLDGYRFFGANIVTMWSYEPPQDFREYLTRTSLWERLRDTPIGALVRRSVGSDRPR